MSDFGLMASDCRIIPQVIAGRGALAQAQRQDAGSTRGAGQRGRHSGLVQGVVARIGRWFTYSRQFLALSALFLFGGMLAIGYWLASRIESAAVNRTAALSAAYVESIVATQLAGADPAVGPDDRAKRALDRLFVGGPLSRKVVRVKIWATDGMLQYSSDGVQVGRRFEVQGQLARAFAGALQARMSDLEQPDNAMERARWSRLLEVYVPLRSGDAGGVDRVVEFYHDAHNLSAEIRAAQLRGWTMVGVAAGAMYLALFGLMRRIDRRIDAQQRELQGRVSDLHAALEDNEAVRRQLREAGARTTALNERFLHRVAADLHDGPAQDLALALLRLDALKNACPGCSRADGAGCDDLRTIEDALSSSMEVTRGIAAGLRIPGTDEFSLGDTAQRAVRDFERKTGASVALNIDESPGDASRALKITVYRLIQEALANSWRHARGSPQRVTLERAGDQVVVAIEDRGPGFDPAAAAESDRLGLAFMRERVRLLGGVFELLSEPGGATRIVARLPVEREARAADA